MLKKMNFKFRMPTAFTILLGVLGFLAILSWFVNGTFIDSNGAEYNQSAQIGLIPALFLMPIKGFIDAADLIVFLLVIGGFIGIMMETESMEAGIVALLKKMNGKELWSIIPLMILFSFGGTTYGMAEETIGFYPILVPIFILAGFDALTGFLVIAVGCGTGVMASTVNPFAIGAAVGAVDGVEGLGTGTGSAIRWIAWVFFTGLSILFVLWYAKRVKANPEKSFLSPELSKELKEDAESKFSLDDAPKITRRMKFALWVFLLFFVVMVIAVIPWENLGESTQGAYDGPMGEFFNKISIWLNDNLFVVFGGIWKGYEWPAFAVGYMWFGELAALFFIGFIIIAIIFGKGEKGTINSFMSGAKDMLSVGIIIGISRGIKVMLEETGFSTRIINGLGSTLESLGAVGFISVLFIMMLILSFLVPSTSGLAGLAFPIIGPLAFIVGGEGADGLALAALSVTAFSFASGIINLFTPTSGVIMGGLQIAKVPYSSYLKTVMPVVGALTVAGFSVLLIGAALI